MVLKRLADAVRDGDRVLAVVRGSAINQDGRSNGMTAPNAAAQRDVITTALRMADATADSVNYVETHGTGTILGDPIEFEALAATYGRGEGRCALGSVKTNIGHLEAAAGVTGFIKAILVGEREHIPPNLHFTRWNPAIDPSSTRLFVPDRGRRVARRGAPGRAAVSSFGLSGTNAHVVIEQAPAPAPPTSADPVVGVHVGGVGQDSRSGLASTARDTGRLDGRPGRGGAAGRCRAHAESSSGPARRVATVSRATAPHAAGGAAGVGRPAPRHRASLAPPKPAHGSGTVFVYSGQGSQWAGMGRQLLADEPAFAAAIDELEPDFVAQTGFSLRQTLSDGSPGGRHRQDSAGAGGHPAGADRTVALTTA